LLLSWLQVGSDAVVRSLACRGLEIAGQLADGGGARHGDSSSSAASSQPSTRNTQPLMGTPAEPYANPRHPSAQPDNTPNQVAGNPLEEYGNPTPQWRQAAGAGSHALEQADRVLPPTVQSSSSSGSGSREASSSNSTQHLMGTPAEPYANPRHPCARPDDTPDQVAANPLTEYGNPTPEWRQAAGAAVQAIEQADKLLPASVSPSSGGGGSGTRMSRQPAAGASMAPAAAPTAAGGSGAGLGPSPRVQELLRQLNRFMEEHVYPAGEQASAQPLALSVRPVHRLCNHAWQAAQLVHAAGRCHHIPLPAASGVEALPAFLLPSEATLNAHATGDQRWTIHPLQERLKHEAQLQGLWNLWLPAGAVGNTGC
jgi:hypothetical protein